jgi:hypothetical protein
MSHHFRSLGADKVYYILCKRPWARDEFMKFVTCLETDDQASCVINFSAKFWIHSLILKQPCSGPAAAQFEDRTHLEAQTRDLTRLRGSRPNDHASSSTLWRDVNSPPVHRITTNLDVRQKTIPGGEPSKLKPH